MSRPTARRQELLQGLETGFRQMSAGAIMFHQAIADRLGLHPTDHKCADLIDRHGAMTAGALADLTGLTTGAITGVVDRLERAGLARRALDPHDRRRVVIELVDNKRKEIAQLFKGIGQASSELLQRYTDDELALLLDFIDRCNQLTHVETLKLRDATAPRTAAASRRRRRTRMGHTLRK
jgi:DNA-binding MarR family transcriptional regulator